jgi:iron complex outermembrane recepter protein
MMKNLLLLIFFIPLLAVSQSIDVSGNVKSSDEALLGVSVVEKGTSNGTTTDFNGNYSINVNNNAILVFSYLGYKTKEVNLNNKKTINVTLEEDASQLDEVVLKGFTGVIGQARRRAESVQNIPESVVTFTAEAIETKGITNIQSFSDQIPNVNFTTSQNVGNNFITVRGISHIRNGESPIAFVIDGVTLPDANLLNQELFDLALIEIVKGPQGALYGKNAIAGAINIVTNQPTNSFKNKIAVGYGSGNLFKAQLSSTGPIIKDKLYYRVSGSYKKGDGLIESTTLNKPVDFIEDLTIRGQVKAKLSSNTTATITGQVTDSKGGAVYYAGPKTGTNFSPDDFDNQAILGDQFGTSTLKSAYGNLKVDFGFDKMKLISSTTYNKGDRNHKGDLDFSPADVLRQIQDSDSKTFNQEIKLSSISNSDSKITWDIGGFYQKTEKLLFTQATADFGFFAPPFAPSGTQSILATSDFTNTYNTIAAFGFIDYKVSDRFTVSAGLRFDNDNIEQDNRTLGTKPSKTDSQLQPKLSLSLKATDNMLMYANYGRGYRSGGFNQDNTVRFNSDYKAEITNNYELGIKNNYWDDRFILNLSTYYINFTDQQLYALLIDGGAGNILIGNFNVPESESYGFEADLKLRVSRYLDILAGYGVSKSKIIKGTSTVSTGANEVIDVSGKNTPLIPQDSFTLGLESNFNISEKVAFNGNVTLKGTGKIYWHEDNAAVSSSYNLLNARFGFNFNDISLSLWGNNILDKNYITEFSGQTFSNGGTDLVWKGQPASFGAGLSYKF